MDEKQLLISRLEDLIWDNACGRVSFYGFLNEQESAVACSYLKNRGVDFVLYGGYDNATRVMVSFCSDTDSIPITPLAIASKGRRTLTHRDYLGSLMGLGVKRECVGDIIITDDNKAVVFVRDEIVTYVTQQLDKVSNESVTVSLYQGDTSEFSARTEEKRIIVSSMRVDNIVSALVNCSRTEASGLISDDKVFVNHLSIKKPSQFLSDGDVISIRGYGKFVIGSIQGTTKSERLIINVLHYI